jgi:hypothetical protein
MKAYTYLPFFYFQQTRLNNKKALFFHGVYEWIPAFILSLYSSPAYVTVVDLLLYYLAFISVYEMGYLLNDQLAHWEENGRKRTDRLSKSRIALFVVIRLVVFLSITSFQGHMGAPLWWAWYSILILQFALHNFVKLPSLNVITFSTLAFIRFFSPIIVLVPPSLITTLVLPVFLNYVLFRLFIYMDSKEMLKKFDRQSNNYRLGYYLVLFGLSALISFILNSWIPLGFNLYYFFTALIFTVSPLFTSKLSA